MRLFRPRRIDHCRPWPWDILWISFHFAFWIDQIWFSYTISINFILLIFQLCALRKRVVHQFSWLFSMSPTMAVFFVDIVLFLHCARGDSPVMNTLRKWQWLKLQILDRMFLAKYAHNGNTTWHLRSTPFITLDTCWSLQLLWWPAIGSPFVSCVAFSLVNCC